MSLLKYTADKIFTGREILNNNQVLLLKSSGEIEDIVPFEQAGDDVQYLQGMLTPGFINSHCHLELSHLKNIIPQKTGLIAFIESILQNRFAEHEIILAAMERADQEMWENGIMAVGDICNTTDTLFTKNKSQIQFRNFIELLGFLPHRAEEIFMTGKKVLDAFEENEKWKNFTSYAPHAPYTVSEDLFKKINTADEGEITSIHNQETKDEDHLFKGEKNGFQKLYQNLNIDLTFFTPSGKSSLQSFFTLLSNVATLILVHNTFIHEEDILYVQHQIKNTRQQVYFCLCPKANLYIENALPPVSLLRQSNSKIILGTDSLASNDTLSILDEINTLRKNFPTIPLEEMLRWATLNGAEALGFEEKLGSFDKGKMPGILQIIFDENKKELESVNRLI
ncbi:MAG: amidohydrolase family protein [Bacteroidetes bacterium]|nr:amidohydrolase family protein [Bacteroidota bacterium]